MPKAKSSSKKTKAGPFKKGDRVRIRLHGPGDMETMFSEGGFGKVIKVDAEGAHVHGNGDADREKPFTYDAKTGRQNDPFPPGMESRITHA